VLTQTNEIWERSGSGVHVKKENKNRLSTKFEGRFEYATPSYKKERERNKRERYVSVYGKKKKRQLKRGSPGAEKTPVSTPVKVGGLRGVVTVDLRKSKFAMEKSGRGGVRNATSDVKWRKRLGQKNKKRLPSIFNRGRDKVEESTASKNEMHTQTAKRGNENPRM